MFSIGLGAPDDFEGWREAARGLVMAKNPPADIAWLVEGDPVPLFAGGPPPAPPPDAEAPRVPRDFPELARLVSRHRDPARFTLLHSLLHRLQAERMLLDDAADPEVARAQAMARAVRRDAHKMHAFLRFRELCDPVEEAPVAGCTGEVAAPASRFVAWYEPEHHILRAEAGFFARRFAALRWSILTPALSAHWDGTEIRFGPGARRADAPSEDAAEALWRSYFAAVFNPARLKPDAMRAGMPKKFWHNLPETRDIPRLIADAPKRVAEMVARGATPAAPRRQRAVHVPAHIRGEEAQPGPISGVEPLAMSAHRMTKADYAEAQAALKRDLLARNDLPPWAANATQPVMGEGPQHPLLMFVGEQPGDEEDLQGRPFVGPAGRLWNRALEEAGVSRDEAYVTNAVKHFKFTPTGKRRLHQSPDAGDITFYRPFLQREIALVQPRLIVPLGGTALRSISGRAMPVTKVRGSLLRDPEGHPFYPTVHPSYLLRIPDPAGKAREYDRFVEDLGQAAATARALPA
jgi:DNA polymerase